MKTLSTVLTFVVEGRLYGPFRTHQQVQEVEPFTASMPTGVSYVGLDQLIGRLANGTVTFLALTTTQAISVRVNGLTGYEKPIAAGGVFLLANYAGVTGVPPSIQNNSGSTATITGVVGGLV